MLRAPSMAQIAISCMHSLLTAAAPHVLLMPWQLARLTSGCPKVPIIIPNKMGIFMFLRLYLLLRLLRDNSELFNKRSIIMKSGYKSRGGKDIDTLLCLKSLLNKQPVAVCALAFIMVTSVFTYANYLCEREVASLHPKGGSTSSITTPAEHSSARPSLSAKIVKPRK